MSQSAARKTKAKAKTVTTPKTKPTRLLVRVTYDTHQRLKRESDRTGVSIREIVEEAVDLRETSLESQKRMGGSFEPSESAA